MQAGEIVRKNALEDGSLPVLEVQDLVDVQDGTDEKDAVPVDAKSSASARKAKGKEKAKDGDGDSAAPVKTKKRKRESAVDETSEKEPGPEKKKTKGAKGEADKNSEVKQRFILFVGNLKYTTTAEAIKAHFAACDPPPTVRLRTPKATPGRPVIKSKGCAFVEFTHRNALQQGLKLHQSELEGRKINVELTVGGGGKGDGRITKLKERNKGLFDQRKDRIEKLAKSDPSLSAVPDLPQRFSRTSGLEQVESKRKTWTVEDEDDGITHRGGQKHSRVRSKSRGKQWGTGVNAIPVG
ncbi:hypothetical protein FB45DRAFT_1059076 [Roridomyces roridus]|uniref:RRM domain-containing protein n=1 Tax=Roridomyces roridus TaxID=1738132 RepID=A0AAD7BUZ8_9AGAR|nr:hypothetical protein FB45DRAFT_1059076 [Roridomyces roridus]